MVLVGLIMLFCINGREFDTADIWIRSGYLHARENGQFAFVLFVKLFFEWNLRMIHLSLCMF